LKQTASAAENLLNKIGSEVYSTKTNVNRSAEKCISDLLEEIRMLKNQHVKGGYNVEYLMANVFVKPKVISKKCEINAYCKANLVVAAEYFERLVHRMRSKNQKNITVAILKLYSDELIGFLFDFSLLAVYLHQKHDPTYRFVWAVKNYSVHSSQLYRLGLYLSGQYNSGNGNFALNFKSGQIASIFVLRQSLELKFRRIVGVKIFDKLGRGPKLKHGFYYDYVIKNMRYFEFTSVDFKNLKKIYEWCNSVVHLAFQPFQWQTDYALKNCAGLFKGCGDGKGVAFHPDGAVQIRNLEDMQCDFCAYFVRSQQNDKNDNTIYCLSCENPEALVANPIWG
jgi:hypothetical protein